MKLKVKMSDLVPKFRFKLKIKIKGIELSERQKKILSTAVVALAVCGFYIWLGIGLEKYMPDGSRENLPPLLVMYSVFPLFVLFFSIKRVVNILRGKEDQEVIEPTEADLKDSEQNKEEAQAK